MLSKRYLKAPRRFCQYGHTEGKVAILSFLLSNSIYLLGSMLVVISFGFRNYPVVFLLDVLGGENKVSIYRCGKGTMPKLSLK